MSKKIGLILALVGLCALSLFLINCGTGSSRPSGLLYVLTQTTNSQGGIAGGNSVSSFSINLNNGNLSLINSNATTCTTANVSCGLPVNIALDPTGNVAFVLNQGIPSSSIPPTIYAYTVNGDGSLATPTPASTPTLVAGDTALAMSLDAAGNFLFVITAGNQSLKPPLAPQLLVFGAKPGSTTLTALPNAAPILTRIPTALSSVVYTPAGATSAEEFLYVTFNQDLLLNNDNTLSAYSVSSTGTVTDLNPNAPYVTLTDPISVLAVNTNPVGEATGGLFVFVGNQGPTTGAISGFQVCTVVNAVCTAQDLSQLVPIPGAPNSAGQNPVAMLVDPTGTFLYAISELSNQVFGFRITTGTGVLSNLNPAYQPTGSQPVSMALQPTISLGGKNNYSGQYLYVSNTNSSNITGFSASTTTGGMGNPITVISPPGPTGMTAR